MQNRYSAPMSNYEYHLLVKKLARDGLQSRGLKWEKWDKKLLPDEQRLDPLGEHIHVSMQRGGVDIYRHRADATADYLYDLRITQSHYPPIRELFRTTISETLQERYKADSERSLRHQVSSHENQLTLFDDQKPHPLSKVRDWRSLSIYDPHQKDVGFKNLMETDVVACLEKLANIPVQGDLDAPPKSIVRR